MGKVLIVAGVGLVLLEVIVLFAGKVPFLGKLPGDIKIERENLVFYFPLVTCLLVSVILTLLFWLISRFK
jgi:hypothetical protein